MNLFFDENNENNYIYCNMIKSMNEKGKEKLRKLLKVNRNVIYDDIMNLNIFIKNIWICMNLKCQFSIHDLILISRSFKNTEIIYDTTFNENIDDFFHPEKKKNDCLIYFQPCKIRKNVVKIYFQNPYVVCFIHKNGSVHIHGSLTLRNILLILIKVVKKIKYKTFWYYQNQKKNTKEIEFYSKLHKGIYHPKKHENLNSTSSENIDLNEDKNEKQFNSMLDNDDNLSNKCINDEFLIKENVCDEFYADINSNNSLSEHSININSEDIITENIINNDTKIYDDSLENLSNSNLYTNEDNIHDTINSCENIIKELKCNFSNYEFYLEDNFLKNCSEKKIKLSKDKYNSLKKYNIKKNRNNNKNTNSSMIKKNSNKLFNTSYKLNYSENGQINENNELLTKNSNNIEELFSLDKISEIPKLYYSDCVVNSDKNKKTKKDDNNNFIHMEKDSFHINYEKKNCDKDNIIYIQKSSKINYTSFNKDDILTKNNKISSNEESNKFDENYFHSKDNQKLYSKKDIYKFDKYQKWNYKVRDDIIFDMNYFNVKQFVCVFKIKLKYFDITKIYKYDEFKNILTDINNIIYIKIDQNLLDKLFEQTNLEKNTKNNSLKKYKKSDKSSVKTVLLFSSGNVVIYACKNKLEVLCISRFIISTLKRNNNIIL
ncbi:conserved Plasmodium protein, unknown function [Plasmodium relictum]|uniref:Uncharacterized protein n=1 Tax=Plasmodium relictum TaxID=85471 RepID=A0A1J1H209_PLARL|nr:conserved Plasmodium protein, unknown function [Plasmodium relictum]CRG98598.1 conserved Plasmodium protein, unknown function [Plasmodium relictum]